MPADVSEASRVLVGEIVTPLETAMPSSSRASQAPTGNGRCLHRQLRFSVVVSASRCMLSYVVIPALSPLVQPTVGHDPWATFPLSVVALFCDVRAIRSVWRSDHRWRRVVIAGYLVLIAGIAVLLAHDIWSLA